MRRHEVAIIVPCYNEKETILKVYKRIKKYGKILIVDDCSIDGTKKILLNKKIKFLKNKKNIGYEASIISGMKHVLKNWKKVKFIITIDADDELLSQSVPLLLKNLLKNNFDIIVGSRNKLNRISEYFLKLIFNLKFDVKDPISGLKIYRTNVIKKIFNLISKNFYLVDILIISYYKNFSIGSFNIFVNKRRGKPRVGNNLHVNMKIFNIIFNSIFSQKFKNNI